VNAQTGKKISVDLADALVSSATEIFNELGCTQEAIRRGYVGGKLDAFDSNGAVVWTLISLVVHSLL